MASDIFDFLDDQSALRFLADMVEQLCDRRKVTTGEYIMVYEAFCFLDQRNTGFSWTTATLTLLPLSTLRVGPRAW